MKFNFKITPKQLEFVQADADEVLFGGAAGGGKSHGQLLDAILYAFKYPGSKQLILRRTFAELDKSIVRKAWEIFPTSLWKYNASAHTGTFVNGSIIDFGYCARENDVYQYQSAEYDVIRFDELTHFTETQYTYLISRLRGTTPFPRQIKSSTNPGNIGHAWVKKRFIDPVPPNTVQEIFTKFGKQTRIFIPSLVDDNTFIAENDPSYKSRLDNLSEREKKALLYGDWDIFDGQYFNEFRREIHVIEPFNIPHHWRRYRTIDYGLDMYACLWVAVSPDGTAYVYKEIAEKNLIVSNAAKKTIDMTEKDEDIYLTLAPPDIWSRSQETGKVKANLFSAGGLRLTKTSNNREAGWLAVKELLKPSGPDGSPKLYIFENCRNLIASLPALVIDPKRPTDCAIEPHEYTHSPDALRGFAVYWHRPADQEDKKKRVEWSPDMWEDYRNAQTQSERDRLLAKYGNPF